MSISSPFNSPSEACDPREYISRRASEAALLDLASLVHECQTTIVLRGPTGIGKSMLLNVLAERLGLDRRVAYVSVSASPEPELCHRILKLLAEPDADDPVEALIRCAAGAAEPNKWVVLLIDHADLAPIASLVQLMRAAERATPRLSVLFAVSDDEPGVELVQSLRGTGSVGEVDFHQAMTRQECTTYLRAQLKRFDLPAETSAQLALAVLDSTPDDPPRLPGAIHACLLELLHDAGSEVPAAPVPTTQSSGLSGSRPGGSGPSLKRKRAQERSLGGGLLGPSPNSPVFPDWPPPSWSQREGSPPAIRSTARADTSGSTSDEEAHAEEGATRTADASMLEVGDRGRDDDATSRVASEPGSTQPVDTPLVVEFVATEQLTATDEASPALPGPSARLRRGRSVVAIALPIAFAIAVGFLIGRYQPASSDRVGPATLVQTPPPHALSAKIDEPARERSSVRSPSQPLQTKQQAPSVAVQVVSKPEPSAPPPTPTTPKSTTAPTVLPVPTSAAKPLPVPVSRVASGEVTTSKAVTSSVSKDGQKPATPKLAAQPAPPRRRNAKPAPPKTEAPRATGPIIIGASLSGTEGAPAGAYVRLRVEAEAGSSLQIDGRTVGVAPLADLFLEPGPYTFVAEAPDGSIIEQLVDVQPGMNVVEF